MRLLIHDLTEEAFAAIAGEYAGWDVVSDQGSIRPCVGCFGCWTKQPGQCVIEDGYQHMARQIHAAEEITVLTRYTYGGFSPFVKNVFDRSIGVVLPFFEVVDGEMDHQRRYPEKKPVSFHFRGAKFTEADQRKAWRYVSAVCRNLRGTVKAVTFTECPEQTPREALIPQEPEGRPILLNCSLRGGQANTNTFLDALASFLKEEPERIDLAAYLKKPEELTEKLARAARVVLGTPLYVDGLPSSALRVMQALSRRSYDNGKRIYVAANMGLYESHQLRNLLGMVETWCEESGYVYSGGAAIGAGPMFGAVSPEHLPGKNALAALKNLAAAIDRGETTQNFYANAYCFPRRTYILAANASWPKIAKKHGLSRKDLLRG